MLFWYELKKILSGVPLWCFVTLCIIFNLWTLPPDLGIEFDTTTPFPENVFESYSTNEVAEAYISFFGLTGRVADRMTAKYTALQAVVDERAEAGDSFSPYFGEQTYAMHYTLFYSLGIMGRLLLQGILLAILLQLLGVGYEQVNNTEHSAYSTKTGRRTLRYKIGAGLVASVGLYALLTIITLSVYFSVFDYRDVWGSSVSSGYNYIIDNIIVRPFATWQSFTVASHLWATIGVSLALVICFSLMSAIVGTFSKNGYIGFLTILLINAVCQVIPTFLSRNTYTRFILYHTPIRLWWSIDLWFTDGGFITLWRDFELWGAGLSFLILAALCVLALMRFNRKDIT